MLLLEMPLSEAKRLKWERGRAKYGPEFVGNPIVELYDELLDAMNYADEADQQGLIEQFHYRYLSLHLGHMAAGIREIWSKQKGRTGVNA